MSTPVLSRRIRNLARRSAHAACVVSCLTGALALASVAGAADATGTITGRVQSKVTGDYLEKARITIKGSGQGTTSDAGGFFELRGVPGGTVTVEATFTGFDPEAATVNVTAGRDVVQNFSLTGRGSNKEGVVKLDAFTVASTRETNAAAIAVNEQRNSLSQKSVISADQFGTIPDNNPGELMKWLPGVSVEYFANNITGISVRGLDSANTEVTFDGMPMASASTATGSGVNQGRNFEMVGSSAADIARVEVRQLRTAEDSSNALGGSVNLVRRTAFEASKPRLTYNALFTSHSEELSFSRRPGIRDTQMQGWRPNFKLTWTHPVSKNFGYAITLAHNDVLARVHWSSPAWNYGNAAQAANAEARRAANLPLTTVSVLNPQLTSDLLHDNPKQDITDSGSVKFDWRPRPELRLSYSISGSRYQERAGDEVRFIWNAGNQTNTNLNSPLGAPGTNGITADGSYATYGNLGNGSIRYNVFEGWRNGVKPVLGNTLEAEWRKGLWTISARGSYSTSKHSFRDTDHGFFQSTNMNGTSQLHLGIGTGTANPRPITVNLLQRDYKMSQDVRAYDTPAGSTAPGAQVDWANLRSMYIGGAVSRPSDLHESIGAVRLWAKRDLGFRHPLSLRLGLDYTEQFRNLQRYDANLWTFVGADGVAGLNPATGRSDDTADQIAAVNVLPERDTYYGSPAVSRLSFRRLYDLYRANPTWFQYRDAESHRFTTVSPYEISEKTTATYVEFTGSFIGNRLKYIGGVRYEKAEAWGRGSLDRGARAVAGITDPLLQAQARYVRKGARGSGENDGVFPSLETTFALRENLLFRLGYAKTQAKNRFQRSVIPSTSYDLNPVTSGTFSGIAQGTVNRPNPDLVPWTGQNFETHLEWYTRQGGIISVGAFRKNISNVQVQRTILLDTPEKLAMLDLEPSFANFQSTTWINEGVGRIDGAEAEIRQRLDDWLPQLARGFTFTGSFNYNNLYKFNYAGGNIGGDFANFYETQGKASLKYSRGRFSGTVGVIRNGRVYRQRQDAAGYEGHRFYPPNTTVDFNLDYGVTKWARVFLSGRNVTDAQKMAVREVAGSPAWSTFAVANNLGVTYTIGITGSF